ncbi:MAG: hypothetical protein J5I50_04180 [Chitinophagaceae bacterium]|nr:hypothetical protein [Chitinophagaceae bacterium]
MKNTIFSLIALAALIIQTSCKKDGLQKPATTNADLRILNATPHTLYNCTIDPTGTLSDNPGPDAFNFGKVDVKEKTNYKTFSVLYPYSWIRLTMNNKTYYLKPYDYSGEAVLESGRYTYKLTYSSNDDQLILQLIKD